MRALIVEHGKIRKEEMCKKFQYETGDGDGGVESIKSSL